MSGSPPSVKILPSHVGRRFELSCVPYLRNVRIQGLRSIITCQQMITRNQPITFSAWPVLRMTPCQSFAFQKKKKKRQSHATNKKKPPQDEQATFTPDENPPHFHMHSCFPPRLWNKHPPIRRNQTHPLTTLASSPSAHVPSPSSSPYPSPSSSS